MVGTRVCETCKVIPSLVSPFFSPSSRSLCTLRSALCAPRSTCVRFFGFIHFSHLISISTPATDVLTTATLPCLAPFLPRHCCEQANTRHKSNCPRQRHLAFFLPLSPPTTKLPRANQWMVAPPPEKNTNTNTKTLLLFPQEKSHHLNFLKTSLFPLSSLILHM